MKPEPVTAVCARCGHFFAYVRARPGSPRRYCSAGCRQAAKIERNRIRYRASHGLDPHQAPPERAHELPPMPPAPDWDRAWCVTGPARTRGYWTSDDPAQRQAAKYMCLTRCPVQRECAVWSLALPLSDASIYGGLSQAERRRRRRAVRDEITRQALAGIRMNR